MGVISRLLGRDRPSYLDFPNIASPWSEPGNLQPVVASQIFGDIFSGMPMTRELALTLPAVSKLQELLTTTIAGFPLRAYGPNSSDPLPEQPTFLYRSDTSESPYSRMVWTVDDLIFYGRSLWITERGAAGQITDAQRLEFSRWTITNGKILVDEQEIHEDNCLLIYIPAFEGILSRGATTLRAYRDTEKALASRLAYLAPLIELQQVQENEISQPEVDAYVAAWTAKHGSGEAPIGFTPYGLKLNILNPTDTSGTFFIDQRNAVRTDVGNYLNVRPSMLDGTSGVDSLTYTTKDGERNLFYEFDLPFLTNAIEAALSVDSVVPRGQRVRFDKFEALNLPTPTGAPVED